MGFYVGQEVECVDDIESCGKLKAGSKYVIAAFTIVAEKPGVLIVGVPNTSALGNYDFGWWLSRFRPLTSRPTDISIFTAMLGPKQKETLDA